MKFEHLVEINDAAMPAAWRLSREHLWFGLLCRAEDPCLFLPGLESCEIIARAEGELHRVLDFGASQIRDCVRFAPLQWMSFSVPARADHAGGELLISIEEPQPEALFLRFRYRTTLGEAQQAGATDDAEYSDFVRAAYHQSDLDTVRVIRELAMASHRPH